MTAPHDGEFGRHIRRLRQKRGMTSTDLALALGLARPHISGVECGKARPFKHATVERLASVLGVCATSLAVIAAQSRGAFELGAITPEHTIAGATLMRNWESLSPQQLQKIAEIAKGQA